MSSHDGIIELNREIARLESALASEREKVVALRADLARMTAERDVNYKVVSRLQEIAMSITTDDDQPCVICGETYDVDHGKDDTGFCHQCATETLAELLATVVFPEAPQCNVAVSERDALADRVRGLEGALSEIAKGEGRYSRDPLTHASNTIEDMKALAVAALTPPAPAGPVTLKPGHDHDDNDPYMPAPAKAAREGETP